MEAAIEAYLLQTSFGTISSSHTQDTPKRVVKAFKEYVRGCAMDPVAILEKTFPLEGTSQMVHVRNIRVMSMCAHHLVPIIGKAHFAYIPKDKIVGLSKIPRMIEVLSRRPQVQENLTEQIVDVFSKVVEPQGCAVHLSCVHLCMLYRGVEEPYSYTETTALRGVFNEGSKQEFLMSLNHDGGNLIV